MRLGRSRLEQAGAGVLQCQGFKLNRGAGERPSPHRLQPDSRILSVQDPADTSGCLPGCSLQLAGGGQDAARSGGER